MPEPVKLESDMSSYWANFAATGDPNGAGLPPWPRFKGNLAEPVIVLDEAITTAAMPDPRHLSFPDAH